MEPPSLPIDVNVLFYIIEVCSEKNNCKEEMATKSPVAITNVARGRSYSYRAKVWCFSQQPT
jgi:hypothetical protein